jgi:MFS family permease
MMSKTKNNIIKNAWPAFVSKASYAMTISAVFLNIIIISNLLWPNESFHSAELGLLIGGSMFSRAFSGIFFGYLADKYSRKKLYVFSVTFYGIGLLTSGLIPIGLGDISFHFFFATLLLQGFVSGAFNPIETSYVNDTVEQSMRSKFYGSINAIFQLAQIVGMLLSSLLFQNFLWRQFYWILGTLIIFEGVLIAIKAQEPIRGIQQEELKDVLYNSIYRRDFYYCFTCYPRFLTYLLCHGTSAQCCSLYCDDFHAVDGVTWSYNWFFGFCKTI